AAVCRNARGSPRRSSPARPRTAGRRAARTPIRAAARARDGAPASTACSRRPRLPRSRPTSEGRYSRDRSIDLFVAVRERDEHRFELRRRDVDPTPEQVTEQRGVAIGVAGLRVVEVAHGLLALEEG